MAVNANEIMQRLKTARKREKPFLAKLVLEILKLYPIPVSSGMFTDLVGAQRKKARREYVLERLKRLEDLEILSSKKVGGFVPRLEDSPNGFSGPVREWKYQFEIHPSLVS